MKHKGLVLCFLIITLLVAACGSQTDTQSNNQDKLPLLMPRLTVNINEQGAPSVMGISLARAGSLIGQDLSGLAVDPALIERLSAAGVETIEAVATGEGVYLYTNGQPLPYLALDDATRQHVADLLKLARVEPNTANTVQSLLQNKIISRTGVPIVIKLPNAADDAALRDPKTLPRVDTAQVRAATTERVLILHFDLDVDQQGMLALAGSSTADLQGAMAVAGLPVDLSAVRMNPATVASLHEADIALLQIETEPEGLYLSLNGGRLPRVAWDEERLSNALLLFGQLEPNHPYLPLAQFLLPYLPAADIELGITLPAVDGQSAPVPAEWIRP
ncbi:MAG: hypothetical protein ABTQ73_05015 [Caldilineales bacterium]